MAINSAAFAKYVFINHVCVVILAPKADRRLVLFYLANDVLQNSRKKGKEFSNAFSRILRDAMFFLGFVCLFVYVAFLGLSIIILHVCFILFSVIKPLKQVFRE